MIEDKLIKAVMHFEEGKYQNAEKILEKIIQQDANNINALQILAIINITLNKKIKAKKYFEKLIRQGVRDPAIHFNYGKLLSEENNNTDALSHYAIAYNLAPQKIDYAINYAIILAKQKKTEQARGLFENILKLEPNNTKVLINFASLHIQEKKIEGAKKILIKIINNDQNNYEALQMLSEILVNNKEIDNALVLINRLLNISEKEEYLLMKAYALNIAKKANEALEVLNSEKINKHNRRACLYKGIALSELQKFEEAEVEFNKVLKSDPTDENAYNGLGYVYIERKNYTEALKHFNKVLEINERHLLALINKAHALLALNQPTEALELYNRALTIEPGFSEAINNRGHLFLSQMNFLQGWPDYEARFHTKAYDSKPIESKKPIWNGDFSLQGPLFIWGEQGVGDQILHSSMLTNLMTLPQKKIVGIQDKLIPLFKRSFPDFEFIDLSQETVPEERYEAHIPIGSLGQFFKRTTADFSEQKPYLVDDSLLTAQFRKQLKHSGKILCGLSWKSVNQRVGDDKSIPLTALLPILNNPKLEFINLQYGDVTTEMEAFQKEHQIHIQSLADLDIYNDLDGLASLIQACDLVITGSNSTAHLAGAMGKETFLLLPKHAGKFWYWHTLDKKSLWYPSINIYQQKEQGEWSDPVLEIKKELESRSE